MARYRFRVRAPDGKELCSEVAEIGDGPGAAPGTPAPPAAGQGYRFRVRSPDGQQVWSAVVTPGAGPGPALEAPRWGSADLLDGDTATLSVRGEGLDGRQVRFIVETQGGSGWEPYGVASATMRGGIATASLPIRHPGAAQERPAPVRLRCHCEVAG